jgi:hypothetical protein
VEFALEDEQQRRQHRHRDAHQDVAVHHERTDPERDQHRHRGRQREALLFLLVGHQASHSEHNALHDDQQAAQQEEHVAVEDGEHRAEQADEGERPNPGGLL